MTKLLEQAIAKVRELPAEDQDALAVALLSLSPVKRRQSCSWMTTHAQP
jgi:hypothetical protein